MRLVALKLERYGCFTDKELLFRPGALLHLVFGENEAGKSTSLSAITDLLFGIESRTAYDFQHPGQLSLGGTIVGDDGKEFSFKRRKGIKNTLLDVDGHPIPEDSLSCYLHALSRSTFCSAFGMNAESLRAGATEMLKSGGDSGVSLFAAAAGVRGLVEMQKSLDERGEQIFALRRSGNRRFYQALDRFGAAKDELRRLELKDRDLRELRQNIDASREKLKNLRTSRTSIITEREQLNRNKDIAPLLRFIAADEISLSTSPELPLWDRTRIKTFRDGQATVDEQERTLAERTEEEDELQTKSDSYSIDSKLLAQADEIEQLYGLTGNYRSHEKDLPRVRDEIRGYVHGLADVARRLGIDDPDSLSSLQPTDGLIARIRKLAQNGRQLDADLEERNRAIKEVREELDNLEPEQFSKDSEIGVLECRQRFEALRQTFSRLPELRRLAVTTSDLEKALTEATSRVSPAVADLDELAVTPLPSSITVDEFASRFDEHIASGRALASREKAASDNVAKFARKIAAMTTGDPLGSPEQIALARQTRERLWLPLRSALVDPSMAVRSEEIPERVVKYELSISDTDRLADSAASDAGQVAELAALRSQLIEAEETLAATQRDSADLRLAISERDEEWSELWRGINVTPGSTREMSHWLLTVHGLFKDRADLRRERLELQELTSSIEEARAALNNDVAVLLGIVGIGKLSDEAAFSASENELRRREEKEASSARIRTLTASANQRIERAGTARDGLESKRTDWLLAWNVAMKDFHASEHMSIDEAEASLAAWAEFPQQLNERDARQRRIKGIERDMGAFEGRVNALLASLGRQYETQMSKDGIVRLLNTELKATQASVAGLAQIKSQLDSCRTRKQLATKNLKDSRALFDLLCADLPAGISPTAQVDLIEQRQEISQRIRQRRESLSTLGQGETEEKLRTLLEGFVEDEAAGRLEAMKEEEQNLLDEINETFAEEKLLTGRLEAATRGTGAELAAQQSKNAEAELMGNAREWAVYRFGRLLLSRAIEEHRTQNQNPLMRRAGEIFQLLTEKSFVGVEEEFDEKDNPRLVGRRDSKRTVCVEAMSKGTRDQLYLSLRLAYLQEYASKVEAVPFIGDDLLTSSDEKRTLRGLQALAATSSQIQPILFTHHLRVMELAKSALGESLDVIDLRPQQ